MFLTILLNVFFEYIFGFPSKTHDTGKRVGGEDTADAFCFF